MKSFNISSTHHRRRTDVPTFGFGHAFQVHPSPNIRRSSISSVAAASPPTEAFNPASSTSTQRYPPHNSQLYPDTWDIVAQEDPGIPGYPNPLCLSSIIRLSQNQPTSRSDLLSLAQTGRTRIVPFHFTILIKIQTGHLRCRSPSDRTSMAFYTVPNVR